MRGFFAKSVSMRHFYEPLPLGKPLPFFVLTGGFCRIYLDTYVRLRRKNPALCSRTLRLRSFRRRISEIRQVEAVRKRKPRGYAKKTLHIRGVFFSWEEKRYSAYIFGRFCYLVFFACDSGKKTMPVQLVFGKLLIFVDKNDSIYMIASFW